MSYPQDGKSFVMGGKTYRWKQFKNGFINKDGQMGQFEEWGLKKKTGKMGWKFTHTLVPGEEWKYV